MSVGRVSAPVCWCAYVLAGIVGITVHTALIVSDEWGSYDPVLLAAVANVAATCVIFAVSFATNNSSVYDPYWVMPPVWFAVRWLYDAVIPVAQHIQAGRREPYCGGIDWANTFTALLVVVWAWRYCSCVPWPGWSAGIAEQDWRYDEVRRALVAARVGWLWWPVSFISFHITPTLLVHAAVAPLHRAMTTMRVGSACDPAGLVAGLSLVAAAIIWQWQADEQLRVFRDNLKARGAGPKALRTGLWRLSRHPNYFGEVCFWWAILGLSVLRWGPLHFWHVVLPADPWLPLGAIVMTAFFRLASVRLMDQRSLAGPRAAEYAAIMEDVSPLLPWPPRQRPRTSASAMAEKKSA